MNWLSDQNSFLAWESRSRDTIEVKRCYVDVAGGDLIAGILLSQIIYWHLPDHEGQPRLRIEREGHKWLAKKRDDWWKECRITPKQFDTAIKLLESKNLIVTALYKFANSPTKHIRIDWENFLELLNLVVQTPSLAPEHIKTQVASGSDEKVNFRKGENGIAEKVKMEFPKRLNSNCRKGENDLIDTEITSKITSEITHNAPLASPPAPPTQESVCEKEELDLTTEEIELEKPIPEKPSLEESTPQQRASLSKNSESLQQTDNPSSGSTIAAGSFEKREQANKPQLTFPYKTAQNVKELIDAWLTDPTAMSDDSLPLLVRETIKWNCWVLPWRNGERKLNNLYQNFNPIVVDFLAAELATKSKRSAQQEIDHAIAVMNTWEKTKGGWTNLMQRYQQALQTHKQPIAGTQINASTQTPDNTTATTLEDALAQDHKRRQQEQSIRVPSNGYQNSPQMLELKAKLQAAASSAKVPSNNRQSSTNLREVEAQLKLALRA
ncbi:hypothetical protein A4S05_11230 [Nostoc sp. KVJ20]|uniref:hypothetical protein n=1 Tax=Nostoc sp. KVJ20 TaxID=457944 RepID=UPI00083DA1E3|nr:hypothetical protein [Nostoc sp. KVJ20]ODG97958.1 hypothetical protein A4S05_11230 [Nostoc sp. KVJ20]